MDNYMIIVTCIFISAIISAVMCLLFTLLTNKMHDCVFSEFIQCDCEYCNLKYCNIAQYHIKEMIKEELKNVQ